LSRRTLAAPPARLAQEPAAQVVQPVTHDADSSVCEKRIGMGARSPDARTSRPLLTIRLFPWCLLCGLSDSFRVSRPGTGSGATALPGRRGTLCQLVEAGPGDPTEAGAGDSETDRGGGHRLTPQPLALTVLAPVEQGRAAAAPRSRR